MQTTALNVPNARRARLCAAAHTTRAARVAATAAQRCRQQGRPVRCPAAAGRPAIRRWRRGSGGSGTAEPTTAHIGNRLPGRQTCKSELTRRCDGRRKRAANLSRAISGNFGRKAGPRTAWREGVFDVKKSARCMRRSHSPAIKAQIALAAFIEDRTMAELGIQCTQGRSCIGRANCLRGRPTSSVPAVESCRRWTWCHCTPTSASWRWSTFF